VQVNCSLRFLSLLRRVHCRCAARIAAPLGALTLALAAPCSGAQPAGECVGENDNARRLACYDRLFRDGGAPGAASSAHSLSSGLATTTPGERPEALPAATLFTRDWELSPAYKRGTYIVRTYQPNFFLPVHYTSSINRAPSSPTQPAGMRPPDFRPAEAKFQVSLRAKVAEGLLLPDADLWFAYTQRSLWQLWNTPESSPFRNTDYQPEAIYVVPVPSRLGMLPDGWQWRMVQLGFAHQSNGQSDPLSRSWNRIYAGAGFDRGDFGLLLRLHRRVIEYGKDDNPDVTRYIGNAEVVASWLPGRSTASLTWKTDLRSLRRGSLQLDWSYPVNPGQPAGLRWYAQLFTGYGETLIDYNHRQTTVGAGLALFQF
jgi:phospholipase A1